MTHINVGMMLIRPGLQHWFDMQHHLKQHNMYQIVETSFLTWYYWNKKLVLPHHMLCIVETFDDTTAGSSLPSSVTSHDGSAHNDNSVDGARGNLEIVSSSPSSSASTLLPKESRSKAAFDPAHRCYTADFSYCGRKRFKPWHEGDPPTDISEFCRRPAGPVFRQYVYGWRTLYDLTTETETSTATTDTRSNSTA